jgi:hypothetical protein
MKCGVDHSRNIDDDLSGVAVDGVEVKALCNDVRVKSEVKSDYHKPSSFITLHSPHQLTIFTVHLHLAESLLLLALPKLLQYSLAFQHVSLWL